MEPKGNYITNEEINEGLEMFWQDKPKELPSVLSGFTPAPDVLIKRYGYVTALIWGRVWRYSQGPDGVCRAKLETIAGELSMSVRNVIRDIKQLCKDGYLKDTTPNLRNRPHIYADTGKIRIRVSVEAGENGMTQSHSRVTESHGHNDSESHEESIKKESKKQNIKEATPPAPKPPKANDFPSNILFREVTERYPAKANWHTVLKFISDVEKRLGRPATRDDLFPYYEAWCARGWLPTSVNWLEYAVKGVLPNGVNSNGSPKPATNFTQTQDILRRWMAGQDGANV